MTVRINYAIHGTLILNGDNPEQLLEDLDLSSFIELREDNKIVFTVNGTEVKTVNLTEELPF